MSSDGNNETRFFSRMVSLQNGGIPFRGFAVCSITDCVVLCECLLLR